MVLLETLTLQVGSAISKAILKSWLKDSEVGQEIGLNVLDILKSKCTDVVAQQRGKRQFEAIGEKVVENLSFLFEESTLVEDKKEAVSVAVAKTIDQAKITSVILTNSNLDPSELMNYLIESNPAATSGFLTEEMNLYQNVLKEAADSIIDISNNTNSMV